MSKARKASVDLGQIKRLSELSKLSLSPPEAERMERELSSVLEYFGVIDRADAGSAVARTEKGVARGRPDEVASSMPDQILAGVPQKKGRLVRAPKVF